MASTIVNRFSQATFTVPASSTVATTSLSAYSVDKQVTFANYPPQISNIFASSGRNTPSAFTVATIITITAGDSPVYYNVGVTPAVYDSPFYQTTPGTLNATGTLTAALILGGIITSSTAAAVTATLDTGTVMDAALTMAVDDSFDWSAINTGGANAFTVTAATGHTIVGTAAVSANTTGRFRTRKTAANTFVTYRLS